MTKQVGTKGALVIALCLLASCTATRPPAYDLPARDSIVSGETISVGRNQNVYGIAKKHGVSMREIIALNDLKPPFALKEGQTLILPAGGMVGSDGAPMPRPAMTSSVEAVSLEPLPAPVDSKLSAADEKRFEPQTKMVLNAQKDASTEMAEKQAAATPPVSAEEPAPAASSLQTEKTKEPTSAEEEAAMASASFIWPVEGKLLSGFGSKGQGMSNDGINIAAPKGSPVVAAAGGMVVYAGNEMKGFGNLVLIRHEGGWVTAYAHLDRVLVAKDSTAAPGDMIGTVGSTGGVASPQLHFETRYEGKSVDPERVLKK